MALSSNTFLLALVYVLFWVVHFTTGKSSKFNDHSLSSTQAPPVITTVPSISIQAQDDSDSCRISWISWVKREIDITSSWEIFDQKAKPTSTITTIHTKLVASPTVIGQGPITTLCDGHPRARFSTSFFTVSSHIKTDTILLFDIDRPPEKSNHPPPECSIHLDDCATQWQHFVTAFKNTTLDTQCLSGKTYCGVTKKKIEIFILTSEAAYASSSLFGGCSQLRHICSENKNDYLQLENTLNEVNDTTQSTNTTGVNPLFCDATSDHRSPYFVSCANIFERCDITVQRFQLIHFPNELISKDICANEGFGMARFRIHAKSGVTMTAKIQNITFRELSLDSVIPSSVMTGPFTFTSPSVYIAYDRISAEGECYPPSNTYTNGIITLHPSELSSMVRNHACITDEQCKSVDYYTARSFNLADLEGDVPASAYFNTPGIIENSTIIESGYFPFLALPTQIRDLDPEFSSCGPFHKQGFVHVCNGGGWDPGIVLTPVPVSEPNTPVLHPFHMVTATPGQKPAAAYTTGLLSPQPTAVQAPWLDDTAVAYTQGTIIPENTVQAHITTSPMRSVSSESIIFRINGKQVTGVYMDQGYNNLVLRVGEITLTSGGSPALLEGKILQMDARGVLLADGSAIQIVSGTPWMAQATPCSTICGTQKRFESEDAASYLDTPSSFSKTRSPPNRKVSAKKSIAPKASYADDPVAKIVVGLLTVYFIWG